MPDYKSHDIVSQSIKEAQEAENDIRQQARDAHTFVTKRNGQWEDTIWRQRDGQPRYQFDQVTPVIDQIAGEMDTSNFAIDVSPAGGDATKEIAKLYDGMIRNIENISNADNIYRMASRNMITAGIDGWQIKTKFVDDNSFDQDLVIAPVYNFVDSVWFDPNSKSQDASDAEWGIVLEAVHKSVYEQKWPKGSGRSISEDKRHNVYYHKPDHVIVGQFYHKRRVNRELLLMSNGHVYENKPETRQVLDELQNNFGVTIRRRRKREDVIVWSQMMDGADWLDGEKETVFSWIPIIPIYGNFKYFDDKTIYHGAVEKLIDYQRVFNYSKSREIAEGALAPRAAYWMTRKQAQGNDYSTMNFDNKPVRLYNADTEAPGPPRQDGGAQINPGLVNISQSMQDGIARAAGLFAASMGEQINNQSGVAIKALQDKGNVGTIKFFKAREVAQRHTARILIDAIPKVYDAERQIRVLGESGAFSVEVVNQVIFDQQTGQTVVLNDLSQGKYDVVCSSGAAFENKQQEAVQALIEISNIDPTIIERNKDILLKNISAPGMDEAAERAREDLFNAGLIPQSQMTNEELQLLQQIQAQQAEQGQQPDPATLIAQAEATRAETDQLDTIANAQMEQEKLALQAREQDRKDAETDAKIANQQVMAEMEQFKAIMQQQAQQQAQLVQVMMAEVEEAKKQAETLKLIREAMGIDTIVGPNNTEAYIKQADNLNESIEDQG